MKVLRFGYIMIQIDGYETDPTGGDWFCYHTASPFIFPPGFCQRNNIKLKVPAGYVGEFTWINYLQKMKSVAADVALFPTRDNHKHAFKSGMKVECTDLMDPRLVCVSTVSRVVGHLLKVHFDGWEEDYDQWMDCDSVDIYPVGWCELVGHRLEGPRMQMPMKKDKKRKSSNKRTGKISKKRGVIGSGGNGEGEEEELVSRSPTPTPTPILNKNKVEETASAEVGAGGGGMDVDQEDVEMPDAPPVLVHQVEEQDPVPKQEEEHEEEEEEEEEIDDQEEELPEMYIPRLLDAAGNKTVIPRESVLDVLSWSVGHVTQFLEINECFNLVPAFRDKQVNGQMLLSLSKGEIMSLSQNKIGPCLKIENLQGLLKARLTSAQLRSLSRS